MSNNKKFKLGAQPTIDPRQVDVTSDYEVFQRMPGNRQVSENHILRLMEAMRIHDLFTPILVNQEFQVVDGQHRLEARRRLGLPVPYYWTEGLGLPEVQKLNSTQKGWTNDDYVRAYIELGNQNYVQYQWFRRKYSLPHVPSIWLLSGSDTKSMSSTFKEGNFVVKDLEGAKAKAAMLGELAPIFSHWKDAPFIKAVLFCLHRTGFDFKTFVHRATQNPTMLKPCTTIDGYMLLIEDCYNYRAQKKVPLRYGAKSVTGDAAAYGLAGA